MVRLLYIKCPKCKGHKGIFGLSSTGRPATLPCDRCENSSGEVLESTLTDAEKNPVPFIRHERNDL